jgi:predicted DNA-binding protein YlxM (UPF0122 family)
MKTTLKDKIIKLRLEGKTYNEIKIELNCAGATISYHCKGCGLDGDGKIHLTDDEKVKMNNFYRTHTLDETSINFNVSRSTILKYCDNKNRQLTEVEKKIDNYIRVKSHRQKIKEKAIEYKGGCCKICGYSKCNRALEFHHEDTAVKDFTISKYSTLSWDKIKLELDKCILVCSNCHRELHHEEYLLDVSTRFKK